jgi:hypothetical protein
MVKILIGLLAAIVIAAGAFFGFEFYVQQRAAAEVEAAFGQVRAAGNKATHGKVSFDLFSRTITVSDIAGETAAQPPVSVKIGRFTASGVSQPDAMRFSADTIDAENVEVVGTMAAQAGWRATYRAPKISVVGYAGPAGPLRQVDPASPTDVYRFVLEHFAAVTAATVTIPTLATAVSMGGGATAGTGDYTYSGIALRDIKDGKIATTTIEKMVLAATMGVAGKSEKITGEIAGFTTSDFDAAGAAVILDPARANDDKYYRLYRQATVGPYTMTSEKGLRVRIDGMTVDDIGVRPSRLQLPALIALIQQMPAAGATPTPAQTRDLLEKVAGLYEGLRIGSAEMRGLSFDLPDAPFRLAAIRFNLENGKIGEFAVEGLDGRSPKGPVKIGRFALKSLDIANLLRMSSQFSDPTQKPSPDQLLALLLLLEGAEIKGVVAPYKDSNKPVNIDTLNLNWGQFVGPIPSRARLTVKMTGPIDATDPDPFKMLVTAGKDQAAINFDLGATWTEGSRTFMLAPVTAEIGDVGTAAARISLSNVPREVFSINPLQAAIMAAQIEAGTIEIALRDVGGVDLAVAQYARNQKVTPDAARRAIIENIKNTGMTMATTNPDAMAIAGALTRFIENPRGTLTVKLTPKGKVPAMQLVEALKTNPLAALAKFQVEASTGR